jgi:hypothetical protein
MMKSSLIVLLLVTFSLAINALDTPRQFSLEQAELLARTAAEATGVTKLKGFSLERAQMVQFPDFFFFDALVSEPGAEGFSGHYAVHKITGEVWDPYACSRLSNPRLSELQRRLRKEIGLSAKLYKQHRKDNPCLGTTP